MLCYIMLYYFPLNMCDLYDLCACKAYIYMYIYIYICIFCVILCVFMYVCMHIISFGFVPSHSLCDYVHPSLYACAFISMHAYVYIYAYIYMYIYIYTHTYIYITWQGYRYRCEHLTMHIYTFIRIHIHTYIDTYIHTQIEAQEVTSSRQASHACSNTRW
jgi:hypothetical protein